MIKAFCDSSFDDKRKICGIGIIIERGQKQRQYSLWTPANTNNYGELWAIYMAGVLMGGEKGIIYSDSQNAIKYINNEIREKPRTHEQYIEHQRMRYLAYQIRKLPVQVEWIKAHTRRLQVKFMGNELSDFMARLGRAKYYERYKESR